MKSFTRFALVAVLVLSLGFVLSACSSGGGGGGGATVVTYATTTQAAAATATESSTMTTMSTQMTSGMSMGLSSVPAGYAAKFAKRNSSGDIGSIDPTMKMMVDKMAARSKSPAIQKAIMKARSFKAKRVTSINTSIDCDNIGSGTISIVGSNNYLDTATADISTYDITFTNCRDNSFYTVTNGTIHIEDNSSRSAPYTYTSSLTANLTDSVYDSTYTTLQNQSVLNGTFFDIDQTTSGSFGANGSFVLTIPAQSAVFTYAFTNLNDTWTSTHNNTDGSDTDVDNVSGTFTISVASGGTTNFAFSLSAGLVDKWQIMNDGPTGTQKNWINGSITLSWVPDLTAYGCLPGSITFATDEADPLIYKSATGYSCPVSGTLSINNAVIEFGTSSGTATDIIVTVNGSSEVYPSCTALEATGGMCVY